MPAPRQPCIVLGCEAEPAPGASGLCFSCYHMMTSGRVGSGKTFVHHMRDVLQLVCVDQQQAQNFLHTIQPVD